MAMRKRATKSFCFFQMGAMRASAGMVPGESNRAPSEGSFF
jgi:hypothetical protein